MIEFRLPNQKAGVHRVAVGIGKDIDESELEIIAGDKSRVVNAKDFKDLENQLDDIREKTCSMYFEYRLISSYIIRGKSFERSAL